MKNRFTVSSDTCCDEFKRDLAAKGIRYIALAYVKDGVEYRDNYETDEEYRAFYDSIRTGALPTTTQLNEFECEEYFAKILSETEGDVVHITLSSGLSGTNANAVKAAESVAERFPDRRVYVVDSLGATRSLSMLADLACADRDAGLGAGECAAHLRDVVAHTHHIVLADDLEHFKRGGRITSAAAFFGTMLHLKPIIHVDTKGCLNVIDKVVGVRKGIKYLINYMQKYGTDIEGQTLYIAHADYVDRAEELKSRLRELYPNISVSVGWIGPIIGAHTGTGTMTLIFTGSPRWDKA